MDSAAVTQSVLGTSSGGVRGAAQPGHLRWVAIGLVIIAFSSLAQAGPPARLRAEVAFDFANAGTGHVTLHGRVSITLTLTGPRPSLEVVGESSSARGHLITAGDPPRDEMIIHRHEGARRDAYPLRDVILPKLSQPGSAVSFAFDVRGSRITASCAALQRPELDARPVWECRFDGFSWAPVPLHPELRHPLLFSEARADRRGRLVDGPGILNTMTGSTEPLMGNRTLSRLPESPRGDPKPGRPARK